MSLPAELIIGLSVSVILWCAAVYIAAELYYSRKRRKHREAAVAAFDRALIRPSR